MKLLAFFSEGHTISGKNSLLPPYSVARTTVSGQKTSQSGSKQQKGQGYCLMHKTCWTAWQNNKKCIAQKGRGKMEILTIPSIKHVHYKVINEGYLRLGDAAGISIKYGHHNGQALLLFFISLWGEFFNFTTRMKITKVDQRSIL